MWALRVLMSAWLMYIIIIIIMAHNMHIFKVSPFVK